MSAGELAAFLVGLEAHARADGWAPLQRELLGQVRDRLAQLENLHDAQERNRDLKAGLAQLHRPRRQPGGSVRCISCAEFRNGALRRATWPCATAKLTGVTE